MKTPTTYNTRSGRAKDFIVGPRCKTDAECFAWAGLRLGQLDWTGRHGTRRGRHPRVVESWVDRLTGLRLDIDTTRGAARSSDLHRITATQEQLDAQAARRQAAAATGPRAGQCLAQQRQLLKAEQDAALDRMARLAEAVRKNRAR